MTPDADAAGAPEPGWRIVVALALVGVLLGFGWGIADQPRYRATATVVVASDSQGSSEARLARFAQRGESERVATKAAGLLGDDVPGADLLADVDVRPAPRGGFVVITATADAPDVAAAAADGFQRALVDVEGDPLELGADAAIPSQPTGNRSAALWAAIGLIAGLIAGLIVVALLRLRRRRGPSAALPATAGDRPADDPAGGDPLAALADRLGAVVSTFDPGGPDLIDRDGSGAVTLAPPAVAEIGLLADRLGIRAATAPRSLAVTPVGSADAAGLSSALAIAAAGAGRRVLVVEADLADPELADRLGVAAAPGLHDHLRDRDRASPREVLRSVDVAPPGAAGFACVPAGAALIGAAISGPRFAELADRIGRVYDLVVYVAPPVLRGEDADAVIGLVDEVVVLVGASASSAELEDSGVLLAGAPVPIVVAAAG